MAYTGTNNQHSLVFERLRTSVFTRVKELIGEPFGPCGKARNVGNVWRVIPASCYNYGIEILKLRMIVNAMRKTIMGTMISHLFRPDGGK